MRIYYNRYYNSRPFVDKAKGSCFLGVEFCGDEGLFNLLMLHGGIPAPQVSPEERAAIYHNHLKKAVKEGSIFWKSFNLDPISVSDAILRWRDTLVESGWDIKVGSSQKLEFIRQLEPDNMPIGKADCRREVLLASKKKSILPAGTEIIVTQSKASLAPNIHAIFVNLSSHGVKIEYEPCRDVIADGDLGRLQQWMLSDRESPIELRFDGSIRLIRFHDDNEAFKYVATQTAEKGALYLCQQPKQFDNILKYLGKPVCGSVIENCEPQVVQLFMLGNGLFEYPLNVKRILAWLNSSIHPLNGKLRRLLVRALTESGGIGNEDWEHAIDDFLEDFHDEKKKKSEEKNIKKFLPLPTSSAINVNDIIELNRNMRSWATGLLAMDDFPFSEIVREQLGQIEVYSAALMSMLESNDQNTISFVELQNMCQSIVSKKPYTQYEAEVDSPAMIDKEGNIHSIAESLLWFCINDDGIEPYPYDFLTDEEYEELENGGVFLYDRTYHSNSRMEAVSQTLLRTRQLTLIETEKVKGESVKRHPLMILLNEFSGGKLAEYFEAPEIPVRYLENVEAIDNSSEEECLTLEEGVRLTLRSADNRAESYTSLEMLLEHPFDYVCQYRAKLGDITLPSVKDRERTMGNVAHLIIQNIFDEKDTAKKERKMAEDFDKVFDEAVVNCGLLLLQPEFILYHKELRNSLKNVIIGLDAIIRQNHLTVIKCETDLGGFSLSDEGKLESKADMLLMDKDGNSVVFDFKWTPNLKKYIQLVEKNRSLQLAVYSALENKRTSKNVRSAYILLPSLSLISSDFFVGFPAFKTGCADIMQEALNGYDFRRRQFAENNIERAEGFPLEDSEYGRMQESENLYPLNEDKGIVRESYKEFKKLR